MTDFEIEFYKNENGEAPAKDFVRSLDTKMKAKMLRCIEILKKMEMI